MKENGNVTRSRSDGHGFGYLHVIGRDTSKKEIRHTGSAGVNAGPSAARTADTSGTGMQKAADASGKNARPRSSPRGIQPKSQKPNRRRKIRPRPAAGRLRDLLQPTLPDAQQLPRRLELHRMPLLPGTQICPPVQAGSNYTLKGVSKWQKSWARLRTT